MKLVFEHKEDILLIENLIRIPKICVNKSFQTLQYIVSIFDVFVVGLWEQGDYAGRVCKWPSALQRKT